ncbi:MAG: hypothetical protein SNI18_08000, partial [Rikenellaceae bacterium]
KKNCVNYCLTNGNHLKCSRKPPSIIDESAVSLLHCGDGYVLIAISRRFLGITVTKKFIIYVYD